MPSPRPRLTGHLDSVARTTRRGVQTVLTPNGLRGTATEIAWVAAHGLLYPWGLVRRDHRRTPNHVRHGRHRDPGKLGDVAQCRGPHRSLHQFVLPRRRADSATPSSGATSRSSCSMLRTPARV